MDLYIHIYKFIQLSEDYITRSDSPLGPNKCACPKIGHEAGDGTSEYDLGTFVEYFTGQDLNAGFDEIIFQLVRHNILTKSLLYKCGCVS